MRLNSLSRRVGLGLASGVCIAALVACAGGGDVSAEAAGLDTIEPGVIRVAVQPYAPYTSLKADKLTGLDSDILNAAAENLGLQGPAATDRLQRHARRRPVPPRRRRHRRHRLVRGPTEGGPVHRPRLLLAASHGRARVREVQHHRRPGGQGSRHGHRVRVGQGDPGASGRDVARLPRRERRPQRPVVRADPGRASWTR